MKITYRVGLAVRTISYAAWLERPERDWRALAALNQTDFGKIDSIQAVHTHPGKVTTYSLAKTGGFWPHSALMPTEGARRTRVTLSGSHRVEGEAPPPNPCKIYVGGLPFKLSDAHLLVHFGRTGTVVEAVVAKDRMMQNRPRGFGFVTYAEPEQAARAVQEFHDHDIFPDECFDFTDGADDEVAAGLGHIALLRLVENASNSFAKLVCRDPTLLRSLEWRDVERMLATVFAGLGFSVQLTPGAKDGGKDIVLGFLVSGKFHSYYVEVKHWSEKPVGGRIVKQFLSVVARDQQDGGILLATSGFSATAIEVVTEFAPDFRFGDDNSIVTFCRTYIAVGQGLLTPPNPMKLLHSATTTSARAND